MMLNIESTDKEIIEFIEQWVNDLSREDYSKAYSRTDHDPYYEWTPELIEKVINGYGLPEENPDGEKYKVTSPQGGKGKQYNREVSREQYPDNRLGYVYYDLPLNGEWSDLTASFRLEKNGNEIKIILEEIHVM